MSADNLSRRSFISRVFAITAGGAGLSLLSACRGKETPTQQLIKNRRGQTVFHVPFKPSPTQLDGECEFRGTEAAKNECNLHNDQRMDPSIRRPGLSRRPR